MENQTCKNCGKEIQAMRYKHWKEVGAKENEIVWIHTGNNHYRCKSDFLEYLELFIPFLLEYREKRKTKAEPAEIPPQAKASGFLSVM
jgi:hypothetical protein